MDVQRAGFKYFNAFFLIVNLSTLLRYVNVKLMFKKIFLLYPCSVLAYVFDQVLHAALLRTVFMLVKDYYFVIKNLKIFYNCTKRHTKRAVHKNLSVPFV